ncbi:MAG: ABC transporter permease [Trueperaceae bacterium]|nr:MAG: ABC transporter permease [Trueperaceae bacterium]
MHVLSRLIHNRVGFTGFILSTLVISAALLAPLVSTHDPVSQHIRDRFEGPGQEYWLGTDNFGRDVFSRILFGYRTSLIISFSAVGLAALSGSAIGLVAAFYGGLSDRLLMRFMDVLLAFPIILLAIGILAVLGPGTFNTALAIGIVYLPIFARLARGPALSVLSWDYVTAAWALGASGRRIILRHVTPNIIAPILVQTTLSLSTAILVEASLSFLGLGTQPPTPSLGLMLSESRNFMLLSPWVSIFSGLAILLASLGFNLLGDGLRDLLDPTLRDVVT